MLEEIPQLIKHIMDTKYIIRWIAIPMGIGFFSGIGFPPFSVQFIVFDFAVIGLYMLGAFTLEHLEEMIRNLQDTVKENTRIVDEMGDEIDGLENRVKELQRLLPDD